MNNKLALMVHSVWGTFEWLVHDAFEQGYRVGICSNSDGHQIWSSPIYVFDGAGA